MGQKELSKHIQDLGDRGGVRRMRPISLMDGKRKREMMVREMGGGTGRKEDQLKWKMSIERTLHDYRKQANPVAMILINPEIADVVKGFFNEWINKDLLRNVQFMENTEEPALSVVPITRSYSILFKDFVEALKVGDHPIHPTNGELRMLYLMRRYTDWKNNRKERDRKKKRKSLVQAPSQQPDGLSPDETVVVREMRTNPFLKDAFSVLVSDPSLKGVFKKRFFERRQKRDGKKK